jgi:formyl-CoA transferase
MAKALDGIRILDFTHVQSGPTCTQLLAWLGADVIKVERPGEGDATRGQLRDIPGVDSLYFTMLNHNKRSVTINTKKKGGMAVLDKLIASCDVLVENFAPGALDRMGITWDHIQAINPRMIVASVKGFGPGPYEDCKVYENVAQCAGAPPRPPAWKTASRWSRARRLATAAPACTWRWASSRRSTSAPTAGAARRCWRRCRTPCSTCAA